MNFKFSNIHGDDYISPQEMIEMLTSGFYVKISDMHESYDPIANFNIIGDSGSGKSSIVDKLFAELLEISILELKAGIITNRKGVTIAAVSKNDALSQPHTEQVPFIHYDSKISSSAMKILKDAENKDNKEFYNQLAMEANTKFLSNVTTKFNIECSSADLVIFILHDAYRSIMGEDCNNVLKSYLDKSLGHIRFKRFMLVMTNNKATENATVTYTDDSVAGSMTNIYLKPCAKYWADNAPNIHNHIREFVRTHPKFISFENPITNNKPVKGKCQGRTLEIVSNHYKQCLNGKLSPDTFVKLSSDTIGQKATAELIMFLNSLGTSPSEFSGDYDYLYDPDTVVDSIIKDGNLMDHITNLVSTPQICLANINDIYQKLYDKDENEAKTFIVLLYTQHKDFLDRFQTTEEMLYNRLMNASSLAISA